ncbi:STAS domain-containing protein [Tropicimonas marinistellae]|uniref:STAS domain-containing protein n=1 Tax=Tropicimonas marinistellae TaxID=1739787 RepID=UPI00082A6046|nr:STAS domain-containing protein [Tropicimonas marinistellae]
MDFETRQSGGTLQIDVLASRIDAACAIQFKDRMRELCAGGPARVILNLQRVDFLDSSGLGAVVAAMKYLGCDRSMELAGLTPKVRKVFRLTRMDSVFTIHASVEEAFGNGSSVA